MGNIGNLVRLPLFCLIFSFSRGMGEPAALLLVACYSIILLRAFVLWVSMPYLNKLTALPAVCCCCKQLTKYGKISIFKAILKYKLAITGATYFVDLFNPQHYHWDVTTYLHLLSVNAIFTHRSRSEASTMLFTLNCSRFKFEFDIIISLPFTVHLIYYAALYTC